MEFAKYSKTQSPEFGIILVMFLFKGFGNIMSDILNTLQSIFDLLPLTLCVDKGIYCSVYLVTNQSCISPAYPKIQAFHLDVKT